MVFDSTWLTPPGYEELGGEFEAIRNGGIFWINNSRNFWIKLSTDLFRNGSPFLYSFVCISTRILKTLSPNGPFASNSFFRPKTISKVAITEKLRMQPLPFFSSHRFLLLAPSFSPFPFPVILELLGLKKPAFWRLFTHMTANFLRLVFKKSVRYKWALLISFESKNYFVICTSERLIIIHIKEYIKRAAIMKELYGLKNTVNDLIDANSQINASYLQC